MYQQRFDGIQAWLRSSNLSAGLVTAPVSMKYLCGWSNPSKRFAGLLVPASGQPVLVVPTLEREEASHSAVKMLRTWTDGTDPFAVVKEALAEMGAAGMPMAVEKEAISLAVFEKVAGASGLTTSQFLAQVGDLTPVISNMREKKSEAEMAIMQRAADMVNPALDSVMKMLKPGVTERQVAAVLEQAMLEAGAQGFAFDTHVLFGAKSAMPHGSTGDQVLEPGMVVLMDFGALNEGYRSDITRTVCLGEWSDEMAKVYDMVLAANRAAIAATRPGVPAGEIDRAARSVIEQAGYGEYFIHRTGHGLGIEIHEEPYAVGGNPKVLEVGHVFTIEPGIYIPGLGGVRIEDDVIVTPDGCKVLTTWTKERLSI